MRPRAALGHAVSLVSALASVFAARATDLSNSIPSSVTDGTKTIPYRLFEPQLSSPSEKVPLILFLHGAGDHGHDNIGQTFWMNNLQIETLSGAHAAYIVAPQLDGVDNWYSHNSKPTETERLTMAALQNAMQLPNVDLSRVYVTGISLGSLGVFDLLRLYPKLFAAGLPMSYGGETKWAKKMKSIPLWAFQGAKDPYVPVGWMRNMIAALRKEGGHPLYTEFPDQGHFIWSDVYADPQVYAWLFSQHLAATPAKKGKKSTAAQAAIAQGGVMGASPLAGVVRPMAVKAGDHGGVAGAAVAAAPDAVSISVPEPSFICLLLAGGAVFFRRRARHY
jgi:poly(3-hydroxybutyrate) depolymerase